MERVDEADTADVAGGRPSLGRSAIARIPVAVQVVLGSTKLSIQEMSSLERGAVMTLDRRVGDHVDILVNGRLIGHGEIVVTQGDDPRFAVSIVDLVDVRVADDL